MLPRRKGIRVASGIAKGIYDVAIGSQRCFQKEVRRPTGSQINDPTNSKTNIFEQAQWGYIIIRIISVCKYLILMMVYYGQSCFAQLKSFIPQNTMTPFHSYSSTKQQKSRKGYIPCPKLQRYETDSVGILIGSGTLATELMLKYALIIIVTDGLAWGT